MAAILLILALVVVLLTAAIATYLVARARSQADEQVADAVRRLAEGMHDTMRELAATPEPPPAEHRPSRFTGELAASLDLDEVAERTLEEVSGIAGVDAVVLEAAAPNGELSATIGFDADDAAAAIVSLPRNDNLRAVEVTYRYRIETVDAASPAVRSGVVLPVRADGAEVGTLSAFTRMSGKPLDDGAIDELERLAFRAGPALDNARQFAEARSLADLDALTGLHNHRYFHETLSREVARAHRYRRSLALLVLDLDDFKLVNDRIGHLGGDGVLAELASRVRTVVRTSDVACRVGGDEFGVIMLEAGRDDAEGLGARIAAAIAGRPVGKAGTIGASTGVAELQPEETAAELFERADAALYRSKERSKAARTAVDGA